MSSKIHLPAAAFAGLVTTGLLALPISSAFASDDMAMKRPDDAPDLVLVTDDDDADDLNAGTNSADSDNTNSADTSGVNSNDGTGSGFTGVSRDRDNSQGDKSRDWTKDGAGDSKRDFSANRTNDRSRNDTRG